MYCAVIKGIEVISFSDQNLLIKELNRLFPELTSKVSIVNNKELLIQTRLYSKLIRWAQKESSMIDNSFLLKEEVHQDDNDENEFYL